MHSFFAHQLIFCVASFSRSLNSVGHEVDQALTLFLCGELPLSPKPLPKLFLQPNMHSKHVTGFGSDCRIFV